jgi:hypothetical protein
MRTPLTGLTVLCALAISFSAQADQTSASTFPKPREVMASSEWRPHVGAFLGAAVPEGSYRSSSEYGIDVGYQPFIPFGLGLEINGSQIEESDTGDRLDRTGVLAKATYHFGGETAIIKDSYAGLGIGAILKSDGTDLVSAPLVGFDIPMKSDDKREFFSLGASAKYAIVGSSDPDTLSINGVMKYWY